MQEVGLGRVDSHAEGDERRSEMGEGQEVTSRFLVACGDAAVVLEAVDQALNKVSTLVFLPVVPPLNDSVFQWWNGRLGVSLPQQVQKSVRIIGPVGNDCSRLMLPHEQLRLTRIVLLAGA